MRGKLFLLPLFLLLFFISASSVLAADWTTFRGNPEHSGVSTETINVPMEEKWNYEMGGSDWASPIVANNTVYVGSKNKYIYAVSSAGTFVWSYLTGGTIESSPLYYNGVVYVGSGDGFLYALDSANGNPLWTFDAGSGIASSPVTDGTNVYFAATEGNIFAVSIATGNAAWASPYNVPGGFSFPSAALILSKQYNALFIGSEDGVVYAINTTGTTKWTYATGAEPGDNRFSVSSPAVVGGVVYIGSDNGIVYALSANNGSLSWSYSVGSDILSSPAVTSNTVFVGDRNGNFYAIGTSGGNRGSLLWSYSTGGSGIKSSPVVSGNTVFIGANKLFFALNATTGDFKWSYGIGQEASSPAISNGIIYLVSDRLYALESTTTLVAMIEKWKYNTGSTITMSGVAVDAGITYIGADDGKLYAINADGTLKWTYTTNGGMISSTPVVSGGTVYFGAKPSNTFYALNTADGTLKWSKPLSVRNPPVVLGGVVYVAGGAGIYALNETTGNTVWEYGLPSGQGDASGPIINSGVIYYSQGNQTIIALDQTTGTKLWSTIMSGVCGGCANQISLSGNTIYAGAMDRIFALNLDGTIKWSVVVNGIGTGTAVLENVVVAVTSNNYVYGINSSNGNIIWQHEVKGLPGTPFLWQDVVFIMTGGYRVYAYNVENGQLRFEYAGNFAPLAPVVTGGVLYLGSRDGRIYAEDIDHYSMAMTPALGGTIMTVYGDRLQIPPGALAGNTTVTITVAPNDQSGEGIVALPRKYQFGPNGTTFSTAATAKFAYKTSDLQGADPNTVKVYVWDSNTSTWTASGGTADTTNKTIDVSLTHFSDYALFGGAPQLNFSVLLSNYVYATPVKFTFSAFDPSEVSNVKGYLNDEEIQSGTQVNLTRLGENTFRVVGQKSDGSEVSQEQKFEVSYDLEWLSPITNQSMTSDSSLPVKFKIKDFGGNFVEDESVKVEVVDEEGNTTGVFSSEKGNVYIKISESHYLINLPIKDFSWIVPGGTYQIKVSFGSQNYPPYKFTLQ